MGVFTKTQEVTADIVYAEVQKYLKPKDGLIHVLMLNSFSKWLNQDFCCENKYTTQIDRILTEMQRDGYEILDVKFNSLMNQGLLGEMEGFHTLITYTGKGAASEHNRNTAMCARQTDGHNASQMTCSACGTVQRSDRSVCFQCGAKF